MAIIGSINPNVQPLAHVPRAIYRLQFRSDKAETLTGRTDDDTLT